MASNLDIFNNNIGYAQTLHVAYLYFNDNNVNALDISELLRAEWVLIVGAMDCYIHDVVCNKMHCLVADNTKSVDLLPKSLSNYKMPLSSIKEIYEADTNEEKEALLLKYLRQTLHEYSFESVQSIDYAMAYIGVRHIWTNIAQRLNTDVDSIKRQLGIIVRRRNVIAHQSDIVDFVTLGKQAISADDLEQIRKFIVDFTNAMDQEITNQIP